MYTSVFLSLMAASMAAAQQFTVASATQALVQCQPYQIKWSGGVAPYFPSITKEGEVASVLENLPQTSDMSIVWNVDQPVGTKVTFAVRDSTGVQVASAPSTAILAGTSTDCLNGGSSSAAAGGSSSAASSSAPASSSSSAPSSSSSSRSAPSSSGPSSSSGGPSSASMTTQSPSQSAPANDDNAAMNLRSGAALAAGLVGIVAAALI